MQSKLNTYFKKHRFSSFRSSCGIALMTLLSMPLVSHASTPTKIGEELLVNATANQNESVGTTAVTQLNDGKYVVTWHAKDTAANTTFIRGQIFSSNSTPVGNAFTIDSFDSTATNIRSMRNNVSHLNDGGFLISWERANTLNPSKSDIVAKRFSATGTAGVTFTIVSAVSQYTKSSHAVLEDGNTVITWHSQNSTSGNFDIFAKVYDQNLNLVKNTFSATSSEIGDKKEASVTALKNGGFALTWQGHGDDIYGRVFNANYQYSGSPVKVNTTTGGYQAFADVAGLTDGGFVVVWESQSNEHILGSDRYVYTQRFNADGTKSGIETKVNTYSTNHMHTTVTGNTSGGYVVAWSSMSQDGDVWGVYTREYQSNGNADGNPIRVNTFTQGSQMYPNTALLSNGEFLVTWSDLGRKSIHAQQFTFNEAPAYELSASIPTNAVFEGDIIELPITAKGANIYGIDALMTVNDSLVANFYDGSYGEFLPTAERIALPIGVTDNQWESASTIKAPYQAKTGEGLYATVKLIANKPGTVNIHLQSQFTGSDGNYIYQGQAGYVITVLESVILSGNVADLGVTGDLSQVTILINGQEIQINSDGSFSSQVGIGDVTISISAPGFLSAEKQFTLSPNQADINFGNVALVAGDSNGDNSIDIGDLTQLLGSYRTTSTDPMFTPAADFNRDNKINLQDLTLLGKNFGKQGPQAL
ncbi:dockerin type I domain-containing protein [Pseudoalteromonas luteoviolacea]|uniref:Dockerin domain-containing protein n=1 Tax=Pseudoalteromonas luteoviolacea NCIMB 1942 TaxID=1365253 RepID=A0A167GN88_9GAMM|nr:dockerin type I domain-containing protein [Pseudoalteromonas luteoviolacea]KZN55841.1 hypothetical protein N482_05025 [Pseudoalteromonas luteoviolacea NCIMB 1942]